MPLNSDFLRFTIIHEIAGVATRNDMYFQVDDVGSTAGLTEIALLLATEWETASNAVLTSEVTYVAYVLDNLSQNEVRGVLTGTNVGIASGSSHPQDQVLRFNEYAQNSLAEPLRRGAFNLSGVDEQFSTRGRVNDNTEFDNIRLFIGGQFNDSPSGFAASPHVRTRDPLSDPATYTFHRIVRANLSTRLFKLKSRKVSLLGI